MCLIAIVETERPSETFIDRAWAENSDGGGIAWREEKKGKKVVRWKKGLSKEDMHKLCGDLPLPFVAHWRKKSIGDIKPELCHPIPIEPTVSLALEGTTEGHVLFHNGTWHKWDEFTLQAAIDSGNPLPPGKWNDTRALAWLAYWHGFGLLDIVGAKGVAFGTSDDKDVVFDGTGWTRLDEIWVSNTIFNKVYHTPAYASAVSMVGRPRVTKVYCAAPNCTEKHLDEAGLCYKHADKKKLNSPGSTHTGTHQDTSSKNQKTKNKVSPFQDTVDELRGVARDKSPFSAKELLKERWKLGKISHSQVKKLTKEFDELARKREKRQKQIEKVLGVGCAIC